MFLAVHSGWNGVSIHSVLPDLQPNFSAPDKSPTTAESPRYHSKLPQDRDATSGSNLMKKLEGLGKTFNPENSPGSSDAQPQLFLGYMLPIEPSSPSFRSKSNEVEAGNSDNLSEFATRL
jgi:hypothetical protein